MLCIALAVCLYLEPKQADAHADIDHAIEATLFSGDHFYVHTHDAPPDANDDFAPDRDAGETHAHHCGGAHAAFLSNNSGVCAGQQIVLDATFALEAPDHLSRLSSSLERPPRPSAKA